MEALQMTDKQFDKIIKMIRMVLDGCKDLEEAKQKVEELLEDKKKSKRRQAQCLRKRTIK